MAVRTVKSSDPANLVKDLERRIALLEKAVFKAHPPKKAAVNKTFAGATGGVRLLISNGFFDRKRGFTEVKEALAGHGYHYTRQAAQNPLTNLSKPGGPLVTFREGKRKVYAKRK
jgi:hypothetical protein